MDAYVRQLIIEMADDVAEVRRAVLRWDARAGKLEAVADAARGVVDGTANDRPISLSTLSLARHVGVEAWTLGGEPVPALLRRAALLLEEYKRFCVHDIALVHDDVGEWLILYGEWLGEAGHTAEEQAWPTDEGRAWRRRCARLGVAYEEE